MSSLLDEIRNLPDSSGVYQFYDKNGKILYIGKAKSLKKRVKSYFSFTPTLSASKQLSLRIKKMIEESHELNYIVVDNEHDALILENSLIKQLHPKYNILLRDDKTYPYIFIDLNEDFPRFEITRKVVKGSNIKYFGPFSSSAKDILDSIYEIFPLVQKKSCIGSKKVCLFYQIKRCLGPCEGLIDKHSYKKIVDEAIDHIYNKNRLLKRLEEKMFSYSDKLLFEEAAKIKSRIEKIKASKSISNIDLAKIESFDIFTIAIDNNRASLIKIFIRDGKVSSTLNFIYKNSNGIDKDEIYKRAILDHYNQNIAIINEILVYENFSQREEIEDILTKRLAKKITIKVPKIGDKKRVVDLSYKNALEILRRDRLKKDDIAKDLKELLSLENNPYTIECYDNSHLQGEATVGAMIKYRDRFIKSEYRHYNLNSKDEYAQMREMINRRVDSFLKNPPPDLMVIDGGATLLKLVKNIIKESGANVDVIAIAKEKSDGKANRSKGRANDIIYYGDELSLKLDPYDSRLMFIQRLRDEAHRFVIEFHRKQKRKIDKEISILKRKGIGEATLKRLLQYFETFEKIDKASFEEIEAVIGTKIAQKLLQKDS